ncbi:MAG: DNA-protecting protein DprA [Thermoanaerobaculia bacterium]|nr:DNA-protecting protein DprA [Thermoanaerobaculia bacterium]
MSHQALLEDLLGPLNSVESRFAPRILRYLGKPELLRGWRVAVVGSRAADGDARRQARRVARELVAEGVTVVSGLAEGVDTAAQAKAIEAGGRTIGVLGNGLAVHYPAENRELQERIAAEHLLLSQFEDLEPPKATNFPQRNRMMALVSQAAVIVDARERSGTVHLAWEALRLGRPLFLLRSLVNKTGLAWPALVLDYGAEILERTDQVLELLPPKAEAELADVAF